MTYPQSDRKSPPWVYLFAVLAILGLVALVLPWFRPTLSGNTIPHETATHSWDGVLFFVAPILMVVCAFRALTKRHNFEALRSVCIQAIVVGVLLLVSAGVAYARVPSNYSDWDDAKALAAEHGMTLGRGPQLGYWLAVAVAVALIGLGVFGRLQFRGINVPQAVYAPPLPYAPNQPYAPNPAYPAPEFYQPEPYQQAYQPYQSDPMQAAPRTEGQHRAP